MKKSIFVIAIATLSLAALSLIVASPLGIPDPGVGEASILLNLF